MVSDASVNQPKAAWAWVAFDKEGQIITQQSARMKEQNLSSYRAEAIGILYAIKFIKQHQENIPKWTLYCDNQALINRLTSIEDQDIPFEWQDSNIIYNIQQEKLLNETYLHVKEHQILKQNESKIDVKLNFMADKLANEAIQGNEIQKIKTNTFRIIIGEKPAFKTKDIKEYSAESISNQYMINKYGQEA
jgi:ribonuclease HI